MMDNMRSHHAKVVKNLLDEKHIQYLYLPPYSPDYNPIENMWSKIKANMRKQKVRAATLLPEAIEKAFSTIHISRIVLDGFVRVVMCNNLLALLQVIRYAWAPERGSGAIVGFLMFLSTLKEKNNNFLNILLMKKKCKIIKNVIVLYI